MHGGLTSSTNTKVNTRTGSKAGQENVLQGPTKKATLEIATSSLDKLQNQDISIKHSYFTKLENNTTNNQHA